MSVYDARGKRNRALLICVSDYETLPPLPAVEGNAEELKSALTRQATDLFAAHEIVVCSPREPWELDQALDKVTAEARGLLLVHFSGHGRVRLDGGDLQLMVGVSQPGHSHKAVSWQDTVLPYLDNSRADRVVVVLECCFSGNADEAFHSRRKPMSLLMAAQPNRRIFSGEEPAGGTIFTRAMVRVLRDGIPGKPFVTFEDFVRELRELLADEETPMGDKWEPRSAKQNTDDDVILSFATPEVRPPTPLRVRLRRWYRRHVLPRMRLLLALVTAGALTAGGLVAADLLQPEPSCPVPLELRLLTAPEAEPTLRRAAFEYEMSELNTRPLKGERDTPDGCRRTQITVYSAAKDETTKGFAAAGRWQGEARGARGGETEGIDPLHRPGPQPDLWVPESGADYLEARRAMGLPRQATAAKAAGSPTKAAGSPATLHVIGPVAYSPLVVGIPESKRLDNVEQVGGTWRDILTATDTDHRNLRLLRPSPVLSGTGLLHTLGLYLANDGSRIGSSGAPDQSLAKDAEQRMSAPGSQYAGSTQLLCSLRPGPDEARAGDRDAQGDRGSSGDRASPGERAGSAPLVSEKSLMDFNLGHAIGDCPARDTALAHGDRYAAYYPKNVPALDHPMVRVDWRGATDGTARRAAVERFARWLRSPDGGQRTIVQDGYRGVTPEGAPAPRPVAGSPLLNSRADVDIDAPVHRLTADQEQVSGVLSGYDKAQETSQVLFLLDASTSMAEGGKLSVALAAASRALDMTGPRHTYGLWTFPQRDRPQDADRPRRIVPLGTDDPERGKAALARIGKGELVEYGASMEEALTTAVREMRKTSGTNKAIVLIMDKDDGAAGRAQGVEPKLMELLGERPRIPVLTLALGSDGCKSLVLSGLKSTSGGECYPGGPDAADLLAGVIASVGVGGRGTG
ncbi:caspase family protein [Streptomyces sp. NPDC003077]|uniref:caspase family protein n=1 Tax=Streptomyces sp. NPDC003077 TaxID=3154443 RepID=UPI0033AF57A2